MAICRAAIFVDNTLYKVQNKMKATKPIKEVEMVTKSSNDYLSCPEWFRSVITEDVVLGYKSALEHMGYFQGWIGEDTIDVYAIKKGLYDNISYHIVDDLDDIEYDVVRGLKCASMSQTVNDMIDAIDEIDEQPLIEGLSAYYFEHGESVEGLHIRDREKFEAVLKDAKEYYSD